MLGVSLNDVWNNQSLSSVPKPTKVSKYTRPITNTLPSMVASNEGTYSHQNQHESPNYAIPVSFQNQNHNEYHHQQNHQQNHNEYHHQQNEGGRGQMESPHSYQKPQEIPYLVEHLTQTSAQTSALNEKVTEQSSSLQRCQNQVDFLKMKILEMRDLLIRKSLESSYNAEECEKQKKRDKWSMIFAGITLLLLLITVVILIQLVTKVDGLMNVSPLQYGIQPFSPL